MYGTIARMRAKDGKIQALLDLSKEFDSVKIPGITRELIYQSDQDPLEFWLVVVFESKEAYWANAQSPEQHARYEQLRALLGADPEWHDGTVVHSN